MAERAAWVDSERWRALRDGSACPICLEGRPRDVIAELAATWVTAAREAPLPGYVCVVSKRHVVEPYDLGPPERVAFWDEAIGVAGRLAELLRPVKMNYEIHGNTIPHLHLHLYPRFEGDPYDTGALRPRVASFIRSEQTLADMADVLKTAL